jgi:2-methylcitrate dehydratase PrpD
MSDYLDRLMDFAASVSLQTLPVTVVHTGKSALIGTVGRILSGTLQPEVQALSRQMVEASIAPCSAILGTPLRADAMWAALAHGTAGAWHDLKTEHRAIDASPALYAVSAGLPVAEREGVSGRRLLESVIAGCEVGTRIGQATTLRPGMDSHGSWPIVAASLTTGLLAGTDLRKTVNLVTSLNLATSSRAAGEGATIRNIFAGFGSAMGVLAADLCRDGFSAERDGLRTVFGTIAGVSFDADKAAEKLGTVWTMRAEDGENLHSTFLNQVSKMIGPQQAETLFQRLLQIEDIATVGEILPLTCKGAIHASHLDP